MREQGTGRNIHEVVPGKKKAKRLRKLGRDEIERRRNRSILAGGTVVEDPKWLKYLTWSLEIVYRTIS